MDDSISCQRRYGFRVGPGIPVVHSAGQYKAVDEVRGNNDLVVVFVSPWDPRKDSSKGDHDPAEETDAEKGQPRFGDP